MRFSDNADTLDFRQIAGAYSFNFAPKFFQNGGFQHQVLPFGQNFPTKNFLTIFRQLAPLFQATTPLVFTANGAGRKSPGEMAVAPRKLLSRDVTPPPIWL